MPLDLKSYWIDSANLPAFPPLAEKLRVDVVVVGGGITGITAAYLLKKAGRTVALLERSRCASVDTGHTTAHLTAVTDLRLQDLVENFGRDDARAVWDAGGAAIDQIVNTLRAEDIACDFRWVPGYLHSAWGQTVEDQVVQGLQREAALAQELGIQASYRESVPFADRPGVEFPHQALFHPRKYLDALVRQIPGDGSHVFENTSFESVEDDPLAVTAGGFPVRCDYVVFATHNPLMGKAGLVSSMLFQTKLSLYTSYALGARLPAGRLPEASFWDTKDPYDYLRVERREDGDYAIFGGEDHKTGQETDTPAAFARLEKRFRELLPEAEVDHRWSGQVIETNDGLPFIGETAPGQFAATGYAGNGMTFGTLGGMMARDAVLGQRNPWQDLFDVNRKKLRGGAWEFVKENKDYPYYLVRDWLAGTNADSLSEVPSGEGRIVSVSGKKVAAYRDAQGQLSLCSAVCTHLKCIVGWNSAENTWDCPCHGSRFQPTGEVISGPAEEPLEKVAAPVIE